VQKCLSFSVCREFGFIDDPKTGQKSYAKPRGFVCRMRAAMKTNCVAAGERRKGDRERRRLYLYSRSAISRSTAHDETKRRHQRVISPSLFFCFHTRRRRRRLHPRKSVAPERASRASSPGFWFLPWCRGSPAGGRATRGQVRAGTLHARAMQLFVRSTAGRTLALEVERDSPVRPQRRQPLPAYAGCSCVRANCRPKCRVGWRVLTGARGAAGACSKGVSGGA
jgi:hypothetical protein